MQRSLASGDMIPGLSEGPKRSYLNAGLGRPPASPIASDVLDRARAYRLARLRAEIVAQDCTALLMYSPINIRYAFDYTNMQIWSSREATRHGLLFADGPGIAFEYKGSGHLTRAGHGVDEVRDATTWVYLVTGEDTEIRARAWAAEIADLVRRHGGGNRRLAADRLDPLGLRALEALGIEVIDGQQIAERARCIKSADEITLMRWTITVAERGIARMRAASVPGVTENEVWAELHHENIRSGGEWCETRLLSSGPRTNPWYQEATTREIAAGDMISFDTDMIGPYGYCADLSRSWTCGDVPMTPVQRGLYLRAREQIEHNMGLLRDGQSFAAFNDQSWRIPDENRPYRYSLAVHGVGMVDEWPTVPLHVDVTSGFGGLQGHFRAGMVVCVESLMAAAGTESIKLETQVLITETGPVRLDSYPWEA
jgi:Xaa-Pro aminopeptidase